MEDPMDHDLPEPARPRARLTVALVGPDGAGKSSITRRVAELLPVPSRTIYMGVNLESSTLVLPTTRLILRAKRARGGLPDPAGPAPREHPRERRRSLRARLLGSAKAAVWMTNVLAEEWFRQAVAAYALRRGQVVIFDRHFLADYHAYDVELRHGPRPLSARVHGFLLARAYPRPDLVVFLDAPAEVLHARKREGTLEFLEVRRQDYFRLAEVFDQFVVVDAARVPDMVAADVVEHIVRRLPATNSRKTDRWGSTADWSLGWTGLRMSLWKGDRRIRWTSPDETCARARTATDTQSRTR